MEDRRPWASGVWRDEVVATRDLCGRIGARHLVGCPAIEHTGEDVKWVHCVKNLDQIALALQCYESTHGSLPPAYLADKAGRPILSWRVIILPYLGRDDLYRQVKLDEPWNSPSNFRLAGQMPKTYRCPADTGARIGETSYLAVVGDGTLWPGARGGKIPHSNRAPTIAVVEVANSGISWMEPRDLPLAVAARGVHKGATTGIAGRHPCGGGDEPVAGVYEGYKPGAVGYRLSGANCASTTVMSAQCPRPSLRERWPIC